MLRRRAEASDVVRDQLVETDRAWINIASQLTATLKNTELWQGKIQFPGQPKSGTLITNNGMITSLRPLVEQPGYFQSVGDPEQQCRILDAYWKGIKMVLPEALADPERFNLQRFVWGEEGEALGDPEEEPPPPQASDRVAAPNYQLSGSSLVHPQLHNRSVRLNQVTKCPHVSIDHDRRPQR